jgi:transcriptional regulator with GAF, ATPase, and Fis domain
VGDEPIDVAHLPETIRAVPRILPAPVSEDQDAQLRRQLVSLLVEHGGNVSAVARAMGKGRMQIHRWARRLGVDLDGYKR